MKKKITVAAIIIVVVAVLVVPRMLDRGESYAEILPPAVEVSSPAMGSIAVSSSLIGKVEPSDVVYVTPEGSGEVTSVRVKAGDTVSAGQVICTIENKQLSSLGISIDSAALAVSDAQTAYDRIKILYENGGASKESFEAAQSALSSAKLQYQSAQINYGNQADSTTVTSPISGKVELCEVEVHDMVSPQSNLFVISGGGSDKVVNFDVTERVVKGLNVGDVIRMEKNGSDYKGTITEISSMVDAGTGLFKIKAKIADGDSLATGTSAKVYVTSDKADNVLVIPVDAVYYDNGKAFVYTFKENKAYKKFIETGLFDAENMEIISGVTQKDKVITSWSSELYDEAEVTLASSPKVADEDIEKAEGK